MGIKNYNQCPFCGAPLKQEMKYGESCILYVSCGTCGRYALDEDYYVDNIEYQRTNIGKSEVASYLYYQEDRMPFPFISDETTSAPSQHRRVSLSEIDNWYPRTFKEKVDRFLLQLASRTNFFGESVIFTDEKFKSACFVIREPNGPMKNITEVVDRQKEFFLDWLADQGYVKHRTCTCTLLPKGLERVDLLQRDSAKNTKNVFVAMSFAPEMETIREAIKDALVKCGYTPRIMNEIEHNNQIVPEMLYEIREARFVVAELTGHNNGAYFEAGYALGQGKDVIQVCKKDKFGEDGHFDVKQVNTILWNTTEDLTNKLVARIKATIA